MITPITAPRTICQAIMLDRSIMSGIAYRSHSGLIRRMFSMHWSVTSGSFGIRKRLTTTHAASSRTPVSAGSGIRSILRRLIRCDTTSTAWTWTIR